MIGKRGLLVLGGAAAATLGAAVLLRPEGESDNSFAPGTLAFPGLAPRLAAAARIEVVRGAQTTTLTRDGEDWRIGEAHGYAARRERVREVLTGLTELRLVEERSADPARHAQLGVGDPREAGTTASLLRVLDAQGSPLAELVVGRRRVRTQGNVPESVYVRRPAEARAWLAEGRLVADADPLLWIDRELANLAPARLLRVEVTRAGEPPLVLARAGEVDAPLAIVTPADPPVTDAVALDEIARGFDMLSFVEVVPAAQIPGEALGASRFVYTDDVAITVWPQRAGELLWVRLQAEGGPEAQALQARWNGWAYQVGVWKEKAFIPKIEDLLPA